MDKFIPIALAYIMFTLGLTLTYRDFIEIKRYPRAYAVGFVIQVFIVPLVFLVFVLLFSPPPAIAFGLMLISFCPGGVTSNLFTQQVGGNVALSVALTGTISILSVVILPILTSATYFYIFQGTMPSVSIMSLGIKMFVLTTVPVVIGMLINHFHKNWVAKHRRIFSKTAMISFIIILLITMLQQHSVLVDVFSEIGYILPIICVVLLCISLIGAHLFGLAKQDIDTIAIESSIQNGSVGMAVAMIISGGDRLPEMAVPALLYGVLMNIVVIPFIIYRHKRTNSLI